MSYAQRMVVFGVPFGLVLLALVASGYWPVALLLVFIAGWFGE